MLPEKPPQTFLRLHLLSQVTTSNTSSSQSTLSAVRYGDTEPVSFHMCHSSSHFYFTRIISSMKKWSCRSMILTGFYSLHLWTEVSLMNKSYKASPGWPFTNPFNNPTKRFLNIPAEPAPYFSCYLTKMPSSLHFLISPQQVLLSLIFLILVQVAVWAS